ncbi:hypothetical protein G9A89_012342 [Geosiphon pyriformis]|nr:hypothetical protein G9A89_012342 [Geosiphon pyriformis]
MSCCQYLCGTTTAKKAETNKLVMERRQKKKGKEKKEKPTTNSNPTYNSYTTLHQSTYCHPKLEYTSATKFYCCSCVIKYFRKPKRVEKWNNESCLACGETLLNEGMWNDIPGQGEMCDESCQYMILINSEQFHKHYQELAPTREEQKQHLKEINTQLCDHCLIPCDFQYCNKCDLIYNPPPCMIYTIPEEKEPISNCISESESIFNSDSNSDNDNDENNDFSSTQNGNENISDSDSNSNPKIYIVLSDLSKEQELKCYSDNNESIMPECVHDTNTGFDLKYLEKEAIKLEPNLLLPVEF